LEAAVTDQLGKLHGALGVAPRSLPLALKLVAACAPLEGLRTHAVAVDPAALAEPKGEREERDRVADTIALEPAAAEAEERLCAVDVGECCALGKSSRALGERVGGLDLAEVQPGPRLAVQDAKGEIGSGGRRDVHLAQCLDGIGVPVLGEVA